MKKKDDFEESELQKLKEKIDMKVVEGESDSDNWSIMEMGDCTLNELLNVFKQLLRANADYGIREIFSYRNCVEFFLQIAYGMKHVHLKVIALFYFF